MNCANITPGKHPTKLEKIGLKLVSSFQGRDVILAIDLTESVGLNDEGRIRMKQIIKDKGLRPGDTVYVVPFATEVNPLNPEINPIIPENSVQFQGEKDIDKILQIIPQKADQNFTNTDIQNAELFIYKNVAKLNQCRLEINQKIKPQSIVWITDAPLSTAAGITSEIWIETPANSPFRQSNSAESKERMGWINNLQELPITERSLAISTNNTNQQYKLTVIDIEPTVQEFCTPAPGGQETCLVTPYLIRQLWLPTLIIFALITGAIFALNNWLSLQKKWQIRVKFNEREDQTITLADKQRISIGEYESNCVNSIDTPGSKMRGYLIRKGHKLYIEPTSEAPLFYAHQELTQKLEIRRFPFHLNCPERGKDFEIEITIRK